MCMRVCAHARARFFGCVGGLYLCMCVFYLGGVGGLAA